MKQMNVSIQTNNQCSSAYNQLLVRLPLISSDPPTPGQFLSLRLSTTTPLLRRPFAISGYDPQSGTLKFIYTIRGPATEILAGKQPGDLLDVILPLGNSLPDPESGKKALIIAGGTGLGPMLFWAKTLANRKIPYHLIFGCRSAEMVPTALFNGLDHTICTDDGSAGFKGTTIDYLRTLQSADLRQVTFYACGPHPMLKACHLMAESISAKCWVSLEQTMACGVGACMGCVVKVKGERKFARVCKEGPVFDSGEVVWD